MVRNAVSVLATARDWSTAVLAVERQSQLPSVIRQGAADASLKPRQQAVSARSRKGSVAEKRRSNKVLQQQWGPNTFWLDTL